MPHYRAQRNIAKERTVDEQCRRLDLPAIVRRIAADAAIAKRKASRES